MIKSLAYLLFLALPAFLFAQSPTPWTVEDVVKQTRLSQLVFSEDGEMAAWVHSRPSEKKNKFVGDLYYTHLTPKADGSFAVVQLTRTEDSDQEPLFSPDGEQVYFSTNRNKGKSLWVMSLSGGEAYEADSFPNGFSQPHWWRDSLLVYVAKEGKSQADKLLKENKDDVMVIEDTAHFAASRLFAYSPTTKQKKRLTNNRYPITEYALSPDGTWALTAHQLSPHYGADGNPKPTYYLWNLTTGNKQQILATGYQEPGDFHFTGDSKGVYFSATQSSDPQWNGSGIGLLYYLEVSSTKVRRVPLVWDWGMNDFYLRGNDALVSLANGTSNQWKLYQRKTSGWQMLPLAVGIDRHDVKVNHISKDGKKILFAQSSASQPTEYRIGKLAAEGSSLRLSEDRLLMEINAHLQSKTKAKTEVLHWKGALNDSVSGILYYPHNYQPGRRYPMMVAIHGGPSGVDMDRWGDRWSYPHNLLAQKGMFVFKPNYHGSSNHGQAFVESIKGHYYEYELPDILTGIGHLVDRGLVNQDSLAVMGWSNGAILATMLTVQQPDLFLVAAAGAGDVNWSSDYGTCQFGVTFDQSYFGGAPWDDVGNLNYNPAYIEKSPLFELEKVRTPTLIHHGSEDRAVPRDQGWEYYRALQQVGKTPVRFLWYPDQPHGLGKLSHQTRKITEELRWFDTYFLGKAESSQEVLKKGSPMMALQAKAKSPRQDGLLGYMSQKTLLPEMAIIHPDSIALSRYEITHAQYQQFRPTHRYPAPHGNHPVHGISAKDALSYAQWLSDQTGATFRLPNAAEAKALHQQARKLAAKENTLAYWAGYSPTLEEAKALQTQLTPFLEEILQPAGSFPASKLGKNSVYDLGGNVAEWFQQGETTGVYGYGAMDFCDPFEEAAPRQAALIGFRVVREE